MKIDSKWIFFNINIWPEYLTRWNFVKKNYLTGEIFETLAIFKKEIYLLFLLIFCYLYYAYIRKIYLNKFVHCFLFLLLCALLAPSVVHIHGNMVKKLFFKNIEHYVSDMFYKNCKLS